jgi:hypothetical protein
MDNASAYRRTPQVFTARVRIYTDANVLATLSPSASAFTCEMTDDDNRIFFHSSLRNGSYINIRVALGPMLDQQLHCSCPCNADDHSGETCRLPGPPPGIKTIGQKARAGFYANTRNRKTKSTHVDRRIVFLYIFF